MFCIVDQLKSLADTYLRVIWQKPGLKFDWFSGVQHTAANVCADHFQCTWALCGTKLCWPHYGLVTIPGNPVICAHHMSVLLHPSGCHSLHANLTEPLTYKYATTSWHRHPPVTLELTQVFVFATFPDTGNTLLGWRPCTLAKRGVKLPSLHIKPTQKYCGVVENAVSVLHGMQGYILSCALDGSVRVWAPHEPPQQDAVLEPTPNFSHPSNAEVSSDCVCIWTYSHSDSDANWFCIHDYPAAVQCCSSNSTSNCMTHI